MYETLENDVLKTYGDRVRFVFTAREGVEDRRGGGLDVAKFQDCFDGKKAMDAVKADEAEAAALGVNSTPTFFVNGRRLAGAQGADGFKQAIEQGLAAK